MPVRISIKGIFPPKKYMRERGDRVFAEIRAAMQGPVERRIVDGMKKRVKGWSKPPEFRSKFAELPTRFRLEVFPAGRNRYKWEIVSLGSPAHTIAPKRKNFLFIRGGKGGYKPHTSPGNRYGGPGTYGADGYRVYGAVQHPGSPAREFEKYIVEEEEGDVIRDLYSAVARALR